MEVVERGLKIGIVLCNCGNTLNQKIDFNDLKKYVENLPGVERVIISKDFCKSPEKQAESIKGLDALIFGGCSERSSLQFNEDRIQKLLRFLSIDPALFETVNLREQCAFIHDDIEGIREKVKDMLLMAYEKVKSNSYAYKEKIKSEVLIIGGGVAGQRCAQALADMGIKTTIVEEKNYLGGNAAKVAFLWQSENSPSVCTSECVIPVVGRDTLLRDGIEVLTNSRVVDVTKENNNFLVKIKQNPQFVDPDKCISCGECSKVCPVEIPNEFNLGKTKRKAIDKDFSLAIPDSYNIVESACTKCGKCVEVCPTGAIDLNAEEKVFEKEFGAVVIATGFKEKDREVLKSLGYEYSEVVTFLEFERFRAKNFFGKRPKEIAFVLCKADEVGYCSRLCCLAAVKSAAILSKQFPEMKIRVFAPNLKTTGRAFEEFKRRAEVAGVEFVKACVDRIEKGEDGKLRILSQNGEFSADMAVISEFLIPSQVEVTKLFDVYTDRYGFPLEFQPRAINPLETYVERVFVVGGAKGFKDVQESIESGLGAAAKIYKSLKGEEKKYYSVINQEKCSRCETCLMCCPHGAISIKEGREEKFVEIDPGLCRGCGLCYSACPSKAIEFANLEDYQLIKMAEVAFKNLSSGKPRILAFLCYWCAYGAADLMGINGEKLPENFRTIRIRCSASLSLDVISEILERDLADGIIVAGCPVDNCHHIWGNYMQERRIEMLNESLEMFGVRDKMVKWEYIGVPSWKKLANAIRQMNRKLIEVKGGSHVET
jgi:heterodisulfide reductase subunit A